MAILFGLLKGSKRISLMSVYREMSQCVRRQDMEILTQRRRPRYT